MNEQLKLLMDVQETDTYIMSIAEEIDLLPGKLLKACNSLKDYKTSLDEVKANYERSDKKKKLKEDELEEVQEKIKKFKAKSTEIKTNKEYEAHLKEIQTFEDNKYKIEEETISIMEALEILSKDLKKDEMRFKEAEENFKQEERALEKKKNELYSRMEVYKIKRKEIVGKIDEKIYESYMNIIKSAGGVAVVQTNNEVCMGCYTNIPPQLYNDIKSTDKIFTCYNCNRYLYYLPQNEPARNGKDN